MSDDEKNALDIARAFIDAGIPVFAAPPCPGATCTRRGHQDGKTEYDLPPKWQLTIPSRVWLERWRPGWGLGAVGGHAADFLDEDPRSGGSASIQELRALGHMPRIFGVQETPSGGFHYLISPLNERETNAFMPGLDYQGGMSDGKGRAFVWIAPTLKRSKGGEHFGEIRPYRWLEVPDLAYMGEFSGGSDDSGEWVRARILSRKARAPRNDREEFREFTEDEAQRFCGITLERLESAGVGEIENAANEAAVQLSHFVPEFWSEQFAFDVLMSSLGKTAYDPERPGAGWNAEKFHDVIAGVDSRAPVDWVAVRKPSGVDEVIPEIDAVDALIAEMLKPADVAKLPPPKPLVKGLLNLDSESWVIGAPGSKKSFVVLDIAGHVAKGMPWQGMPVERVRVVLIVAEGAGGMGPRVRAWERRYGPMGDDVWILPRPVQAADLKAWAVLREACRRIGPGLVVIDTQARSTVGLEENSAKEMGIYVEAVRSIREATGACVLSVHHTGRAGGDARGSSAIDGAQFTELKVKCEKGTLRGVLVTEKQKDMEEGADVPLVFDVVEVEEGVSSLVLVADGFRAASGLIERPEIEDWEVHHGKAQVHLLKVLRDQGGTIGLTKAEARVTVVERFYGGDPKKLARSTWATAWTRVLEKSARGGEPVVVSAGGQRWMLDPIAFGAFVQESEESST